MKSTAIKLVLLTIALILLCIMFFTESILNSQYDSQQDCKTNCEVDHQVVLQKEDDGQELYDTHSDAGKSLEAKSTKKKENESLPKRDEEGFIDFYQVDENNLEARHRLLVMPMDELAATCDALAHEDYQNIKEIMAERPRDDYYVTAFKNERLKGLLFKVTLFKCIVNFNKIEGEVGKSTAFFVALGSDKNIVFKLLAEDQNLVALRVANKRMITLPQKYISVQMRTKEEFVAYYGNEENNSAVRDRIQHIMTYEELAAACDTLAYEDYGNVNTVKAIRQSDTDYFIVLQNNNRRKKRLLEFKVFKCVVQFNDTDRTQTEFFVTLGNVENTVFKLLGRKSLFHVPEGSRNLGLLHVASKRAISIAKKMARLQEKAELNFLAYYEIKENNLEAKRRLGKMQEAGELFKVCDTLGHNEFEYVKEVQEVAESTDYRIVFHTRKMVETHLEVEVFKCIVQTGDIEEDIPVLEKIFFLALGRDNTYFKLLPITMQGPENISEEPRQGVKVLRVVSHINLN